jgi:hypothetical protein
MARGVTKKTKSTETQTVPYRHPEAKSLMRPEVGTQAQFKKKKAPKTYRYDSSLSPALDWDGKNPAREEGEQLIQQILGAKTLEEAKAAASKLKSLSKPFLNWAGKAERLSFDVPTLPLFIHERLSTKAIIETLAGHKRDQQQTMFDLFGDPQRSITDQVLKAYEYQDNWSNRMVLGDSLVVMNSLLHYEGLGGQVQMIYMDPPYGVKFGSNFQPFVRKRDVSHNDDEDMTREPEMVQAYRDTWELGLHSYLTYLRDRLLLARNLLTPSGSIFVQISDENLHHVREVMDEVFGAENCVSVIAFQKTSSASGELLSSISDYLIWFAKDKSSLKYRQIYLPKKIGEDGGEQYTWVQFSDGVRKNLGGSDKLRDLPEGAKVFRQDNLTSQRPAQEGDVREFEFEGRKFTPGKGTFKSNFIGLSNLAKSLSVNYIYRQRDFSERDDRRGKMGEAEETAFEFLIPHEQLAKAIEPAMRDLHNPPPGSLRRMPPLLLGFLPAPFDMGDVAMLFNGDTCRNAGVACIGTQVLAASLRRRGTRHYDGVKDDGQLAHIMPVCRGHDDRQRDATIVHQQVALASIFFPDPSGSARPLPEPAALSSWPRRYSASATRCLPRRHTPPARPARGLRTGRRSATRESACEWRSRSQSARSATPSTDSPCATRRRCPRTPGAPPWVCAHPRVCARRAWPSHAGARGSRVRPVAKTRPTLPMLPPCCASHVSPSLISPIRPSRDGRQCTILFTDKL